MTASLTWKVSIETLARIKKEIAAAEALFMTQKQIDAVAPDVMRRLFPHMDAEISAAIASRQVIHLEVQELTP